ncbi:DUF1848 domain-containing protein [Ruminococcus flavefaciens]|uniref:DUF1848 domain-containing protein n=1 Tax=Ruminococcus flavefaciens TaxID=1265 RepID=UPI0026E9737E|nr:DUF1848 domain-containing protein [Ruminococcus flavefaciens]
MIISASRRTDIPAFYSDWFYNRISEGYVMVRNPMNYHQVSKITLSPEVVDCIVFWSKNPAPMLDRIDELDKYNYYFQFTLNSYAKDIEPNVPLKDKEVIKTFKALSDKIGNQRVIWRYDPILLNEKYTIDYHLMYFEKLADLLNGTFGHCVISFIDVYKKITNNIKLNSIVEPSGSDIDIIGKRFSEIAKDREFKIVSCAEKVDLYKYGIEHGKCIDDSLIEQITGMPININKDKNQRSECGCVESIDIGLYNTCLHGCKYCYANYSDISVAANAKTYDVNSPLLCSKLESEDKVTIRNVSSVFDGQLRLFDN